MVRIQVILELDAGRLLRSDTINPRLLDWITLVSISQEEIDALPPNRLGIGEQSVIAYANSHVNCVAGLDDRQARVLAEQLGLKVVGVIGILLKAKQTGLLSSVRPFFGDCPGSGFSYGQRIVRGSSATGSGPPATASPASQARPAFA